ncbi:hypothetical protein CA12_25300 [Alienimonas californiensis]|uniref:DUF1559 domain-containing protein n=1 Tax=Alienimonas californiensis TaxID=2527989 RepID=A0A517PAN0_9PLAN|nr:hypothetical protein CA12_25300 [Alienimonas californiensis]
MVELLVVIGVVALLVALVLPAVHSARESARVTQCRNNLRQTALALQNHHAARGSLPSYYNGTSLQYPLGEWDLFHLHSWRTPLLPYLDQAPLAARLDLAALATGPENEAAAQTPVPTFLCPSGDAPTVMGWGLKHDRLAGLGDVPLEEIPDEDRYSVVRSDYDAMAGIQTLPDPFPEKADSSSVDFVRWGAWGWPVFEQRTTAGSRLSSYRAGRFADVRDGLSNTISLVERAGKPTELLNGKPAVTSGNPNALYPGQVGWSASNTFLWSINADGVGVNESNSRGIYSFHPGGANVAVADGSVRFLSDSTNFETLVALYGRSDGGLPD